MISVLSHQHGAEVDGSRNYIVALDETYWHPNYELMKGGILIGGPFHDACGTDPSRRPESEAANIDHDQASRMSLSFCVARADCSSHIYDVCMVPMGGGESCKAERFLRLLDQVPFNFMEANQCPPIGCAWDGGLSNRRIMQMFLGLIDPEEFSPYRFFGRCSVVKPAGIKFWYCGVLLHRQRFYMHGNIDSCHVLKRLSIQGLSANKTSCFGSIRLLTFAHHL